MSSTLFFTRHRGKLFLAILALGTALRLFRIGAQSLWLDEALSVNLSQRSWDQIIAGTAQDTLPPLYYLLEHSLLVFGANELTVRLLSALLGILTIPLLYLTGRFLFDDRTGLLSAFLLAISPFHIFYSQEAKMYTQLAFFGLLAVLFFARAWREGKRRDWLGFVLGATAGMYTHTTAFLLFAALGAFALVYWRETKERWRALATSLGFVGLLFAPWMVSLSGQAARVGSGFWVETPSVLQVFTTIALFVFGYTLSPLLSALAILAALYAAFVSLLVSWHALRTSDPCSRSLTMVLCLFLGPILTSLVVSLVYPIFLPRTLIASSLALLLLLSWGLTRMNGAAAALLGVIGLLLTVFGLGTYYVNPAVAKPPMREAATWVQVNVQPGDTILHTSDSSFLVFAFYEPGLDRHFTEGDPDYEQATTRAQSGRIAGIIPEPLEAILHGKQRLWLVIALDHNVEYQKQLLHRIEGCYPRVDSKQIGGIQILLFDLERQGTCP